MAIKSALALLYIVIISLDLHISAIPRVIVLKGLTIKSNTGITMSDKSTHNYVVPPSWRGEGGQE